MFFFVANKKSNKKYNSETEIWNPKTKNIKFLKVADGQQRKYGNFWRRKKSKSIKSSHVFLKNK